MPRSGSATPRRAGGGGIAVVLTTFGVNPNAGYTLVSVPNWITECDCTTRSLSLL
jgi:hypothetical protein